ncbi:MAG: YebC/PmpR family DNA-binding transcriptional regulator, partial [Spirochaetia bacterium]
MQAGGFTHESAEILKVPDARVALDDEGTRKALRLIEALEDYDDIQEVSSNIDIPDDFEMDE